MSPATNPVTLSLNVTVTGIEDMFVGFEAVVVNDTVGAVSSYVLVKVAGPVFVFPAASCATPAATLILTAEPVGATLKL